MYSSQYSKGFMSLHVPTNKLQNVIMSEMEELVDYEDSEKDDQRWTDSSREGNLLTDESGNIGRRPDEPPTTTTEARVLVRRFLL